MTITLRKAIAGLAAAGSLTLAGAAPALAGPATAVTGTFYCTDTVSGDFVASGNYVVNSGNSNAQTWNAAYLTFASGGTGVFIQTAQAFSVNGTPLPRVFKGSATPADPGPVQCSIQTDDGTVTGTVWGKIVTNGRSADLIG